MIALSNLSAMLLRLPRRLRRDQRGSVAATFLATSSILIWGTFASIDLVRYSTAQTRLSNAMDAAVLTAGVGLDYIAVKNGADGNPDMSDAATKDWVDSTNDFLMKSLGSSIRLDAANVHIIYDSSKQTVNMSAAADLPVISTGLLKTTAFNLSAQNQATHHLTNDLEVVLALDNTMSMAGSKITSLISAATGFVDDLLNVPNIDQYKVYVGLVPFANTVNVMGPNITKAKDWVKSGGHKYSTNPYQAATLDTTDPNPIDGFINNQWTGCITEPTPNAANWPDGQMPALALPPGATDPFDAGFRPLHYTYRSSFNIYAKSGTSSSNNYYLGLSSSNVSGIRIQDILYQAPSSGNDQGIAATLLDSSQNPTTAASAAYSASVPVYATVAMNTEDCPASSSSNALLPTYFLSQDLDNLKAEIGQMDASGMGTNVPTGLLWAWRMISTDWRGAWDDSNMPRDPSKPADDAKYLRKVIVLLTDGDNQPMLSHPPASGQNADYKVQFSYQTCPSGKWNTTLNDCADTSATTSTTTQPSCTGNGSSWAALGTCKKNGNGGNPQLNVLKSDCPNNSTWTANSNGTGVCTITTTTPAWNLTKQTKTFDTKTANYKISSGSISTDETPLNSLIMLDPTKPLSGTNTDSSASLIGIGYDDNFSGSGSDNRHTYALGDSDNYTDSRTATDNFLSALCTKIKGAGAATDDYKDDDIIIYTIALNDDGKMSNAQKTLLKNCASGSTGPFYTVVSNSTSQLSGTFASIVGNLSTVRLTQ